VSILRHGKGGALYRNRLIFHIVMHFQSVILKMSIRQKLVSEVSVMLSKKEMR